MLVGLRKRGDGRATPTRRLLLAALSHDRKHGSAEDLAGEVRAEAPDVSISTIYRNPDELVPLGVVDRAYLGGGPAAFHLASATHGYLACEQCGRPRGSRHQQRGGGTRGGAPVSAVILAYPHRRPRCRRAALSCQFPGLTRRQARRTRTARWRQRGGFRRCCRALGRP